MIIFYSFYCTLSVPSTGSEHPAHLEPLSVKPQVDSSLAPSLQVGRDKSPALLAGDVIDVIYLVYFVPVEFPLVAVANGIGFLSPTKID